MWRLRSATASLPLLDSVPHATAPRGGERHRLMGGTKETPPRAGKDHQPCLIKTLRWFFRSCTHQVQKVAETSSVISKTLCWIFRGSGLQLKAWVVYGLVRRGLTSSCLGRQAPCFCLHQPQTQSESFPLHCWWVECPRRAVTLPVQPADTSQPALSRPQNPGLG